MLLIKVNCFSLALRVVVGTTEPITATGTVVRTKGLDDELELINCWAAIILAWFAACWMFVAPPNEPALPPEISTDPALPAPEEEDEDEVVVVVVVVVVTVWPPDVEIVPDVAEPPVADWSAVNWLFTLFFKSYLSLMDA